MGGLRVVEIEDVTVSGKRRGRREGGEEAKRTHHINQSLPLHLRLARWHDTLHVLLARARDHSGDEIALSLDDGGAVGEGCRGMRRVAHVGVWEAVEHHA